MYSLMGSLYLSASISSCRGKYGNASLICWIVIVSRFRWM